MTGLLFYYSYFLFRRVPVRCQLKLTLSHMIRPNLSLDISCYCSFRFLLILFCWRVIVNCFLVTHIIIYSWKKRAVIQYHREIFFAFNIDVTHLGYHPYYNGAGNLWEYGCTVAPPIAYICLNAVWSIGGVKNWHFIRAATGNQLCICDVSRINPFVYDFSVWCLFRIIKRGEPKSNPI